MNKSRLLLIMLVILLGVSIFVPYYILSLNNLYTQVGIVFDFGQLRYGGYNLTGSVNVALMGPGGISIHRYDLSDVQGRMVTIDLKDGVMAWDRYFKDILPKNMRVSMEYDVPLPAITIFMILHDNAGNEYIASYVYSTFDYLMDIYQDNDKATNEAINDPLIMFRTPLLIKVTREKLGIRKVDFGPVIEDIRKSLGKASSISTSNINGYGVASCPSYFTEVYWGTLYNTRNSLPDGWRQRISGYNINDQMKLEAWNYYATEYSLAYYYKTDEYTYKDALTAVKNMLGEEGIYTMRDFLYYIFYKMYGNNGIEGLNWNSVYALGTVFSEDVPILSIWVDYVERKPIGFRIEAEKWPYGQYKHGLSIMGTLAIGASMVTTYYKNKMAYVMLVTRPGQYIFIPTKYEYSGEGVILIYDVSPVTYGGCNYWRVVPVTILIPIYLKTSQDWRGAYVIERGFNDTEPRSFNKFVWDYDVNNIYWTYANDNLPLAEPFFQHSSVEYPVSEYFAGQELNIMRNLLSNFLSSVLSSAHPVAALMMGIVGGYVGYAETNAWNTAIILKLEAFRRDMIKDDVYVSINKYTIKYAFNKLHIYLPIISRYWVQVGSSPSSGQK